MAVSVVRGTPRDGIDLEDLEKFAGKMMALGTAMLGFEEIKEYKADDGESMVLATFKTRPEMIAWRDHAEHKEVPARGRKRYFTEYDVRICEVIRHYSFADGNGLLRRGPTVTPDWKKKADICTMCRHSGLVQFGIIGGIRRFRSFFVLALLIVEQSCQAAEFETCGSSKSVRLPSRHRSTVSAGHYAASRQT
jgi:heme-degrading monooxygenase HmoA